MGAVIALPASVPLPTIDYRKDQKMEGNVFRPSLPPSTDSTESLLDVEYVDVPIPDRGMVHNPFEFIQWFEERRGDFELAAVPLYYSMQPGIENEWTQLSFIDHDIILGGIPIPDNDSDSTNRNDPRRTPHPLVARYKIRTIISFSDYHVVWDLSYISSYRHYIVYDHPQTEMYKVFDEVAETIDGARRRGEITFIHCQAGVSRSSTALAAYYIRFGLRDDPHPTVERVLRYLQEARSVVWPNYGFIVQLLGYYQYLKNR